MVSPRRILLHDALVSPVTAMRSDNFTPASIYRPSPRPDPRRLPPIEYPEHHLVKRITSGGTFKFGRRLLFLATLHDPAE